MTDLPILYEDNDLLAVVKPSGLLVHGVSANNLDKEPTVVAWLIEKDPEITKLGWPDRSRPGIVHRLDKDTSGVMVVAKTPVALANLQKQFAERTTLKIYDALVAGNPTWEEKTVDAPISRGEGTRRKTGYLQLPGDQAKPAQTAFRVLKHAMHSGSPYALIEAEPKTGRTHQIRVHLGLIDLPILGDPWYQTKLSKKLAEDLSLNRLMLHARELFFDHPTTGERLHFVAETPPEFNQ